MKKIIWLFPALLCLFASCKKNGSTPNNSANALSGSWNFTSLTSQTEASDEYNIGGDDFKDVTTSNYTSTDNAGTVNFSGGTAKSSGISYSVSTTLFLSSYEDNVLVDTTSSPFSSTVPSSGGTSTYKIIGTDSVFFAGGFVTSGDLTGGAPQPSTAIGYKFHVSGNTLIMTSAIAKDSIEDLGGVSTQVHEAASFSVTLTKQ
ncbi:MAG TPA: hypothetical protein VKR53_11635 [Puia sp.]|nr:hypothetical protein [Puia sp.]